MTSAVALNGHHGPEILAFEITRSPDFASTNGSQRHYVRVDRFDVPEDVQQAMLASFRP